MEYSPLERRLLGRYFTVLDPAEHADVYLARNLPPEVAATLNGVYSRSHLSMRDNFLQRLKKGLEESGRRLEDLDVAEPAADVLSEVLADKSGKFLKTYAIDHGHNSLREGSVLQFAVENVSQLVTRFVQRERRCSFEESSTRYIPFTRESHWRDPDVMAAGGRIAAAYEDVLRSTFQLYERLTEALVQHLAERRPLPAGDAEGPWRRALRAEAFDAARYLLTPAVFTKWGLVCDARTLADIVSELLSHPLSEFRRVGERLREQGELAVPTLLAHAKPNGFLQAQHMVLSELVREVMPLPTQPRAAAPEVRLLAFDPALDERLLASLLFEHTDVPFEVLQARVRGMTADQRRSLLDRALAGRGPRDALPAGLEGAQPFEFEVMVDFGAYRDIGRHRKGFQQQQRLTTAHGYLVPPLVADAGFEADYRRVLDRAAELQQEVAASHPLAAGYVTPFAFLQRVRLMFDPRQVAYFIELRSGPEGHFAYRDVAIGMFREVERVSPLFASAIRVQLGRSFLGRLEAERGADERRRQRMIRAGDLPAEG